MKTAFVDTDIMLDYLLEREPFYANALNLMNVGATNKVKLFISVMTVATLIYFLEKKFNRKEIQQKIKLLRTFVSIAEGGSKDVDEISDSGFHDLEDALRHAVARNNKADVLVTRNKNDYKLAMLPVMNAAEFLKSLSMEKK